MRHLFLTMDRPDLQFVTKEISRAMSQPTVNGDETLKDHRNEDLVTLTVKILMHDYDLEPSQEVALVDANWAVCQLS